MLLEIVSWNSHALNDSNYGAWFPFGQPMMPDASPSFAPRSRTWAKLSNKEIKGATLSFHVLCKGTFHSQYEELKSWFPIDDFELGTLIVQDLGDSNRQWMVRGYAIQPLFPAGENTAGEYVVTLALDEPLWRTVTTASDAWAITASAQTNSLSILGNHPARPIFTITINGAKGGGFNYRWWRPYYNPLSVENGQPLEITGGWNTEALIADTSVSNRVNQGGGIDASTLSIPLDTSVGGGLNTSGGMCYVDTEQIYYTSISGGVMTVASNGRGYGGTTAATHADNALMKKSQMMANGQDVRVQNNGVFVDAWITGINTTSTKVWILPVYRPAIEMILDVAISDVGSAGTITVKKTAANQEALRKLPASFLFYIGTEVFLGNDIKPQKYQFTVVARAQKGSVAAVHSVGDTIRWVEHDLYLVWGDPLVEAAVVDDTRKPIFNLSTSTNTSWVHETFASDDGLRSASWVSALIRRTGTESYLYTDTEGALASPATVMGFAAKVFKKNGKTKAENFTFAWQLYHPAGFTTVTASGKKRRLSTDWPTTMAFQKSANGVDFSNVFNEATPASPGSFGALAAHSGVALGAGTWPYVRFYGNGTVKASADNECDMELSDTTLVLTSASVLQLAFATTADDSYWLDTTLTVVETEEAVRLTGACKVGSVIVLDCDAETLTVDGVEGGVGLAWNTVRTGWLDLPSPKQEATCTLRYDEDGVEDVSVDTEWEHRNTL